MRTFLDNSLCVMFKKYPRRHGFIIVIMMSILFGFGFYGVDFANAQWDPFPKEPEPIPLEPIEPIYNSLIDFEDEDVPSDIDGTRYLDEYGFVFRGMDVSIEYVTSDFARSGNNVLNPCGLEFCQGPLLIEFSEPYPSRVDIFAGLDSPVYSDGTLVMKALSENSTIIDQQRIPIAEGNSFDVTKHLWMTSESNNIHHVEVFFSSGGSFKHLSGFRFDDFSFFRQDVESSLDYSVNTPPHPPILDIISPSHSSVYHGTINNDGEFVASVPYEVEIRSQHRLDKIEAKYGFPDETYESDIWCNSMSDCDSWRVSTVTHNDHDDYNYRISFNDNVRYNQAGEHSFLLHVSTVHYDTTGRNIFQVTLPETKIDLRIIGIEFTQGITNKIHHVGQSSEIGVSDYNNPLHNSVAGLPGLFRVYVTVEKTDGMPTTPAVGFPVTGTLSYSSTSYRPHDPTAFTINPLDNSNCRNHLENHLPCESIIGVYPSIDGSSLGTSGYTIDLIDQRSRWNGTLNFVLSAEQTKEIFNRGDQRYEITVTPTSVFQETNPSDNSIVIEARRADTVYNPLKLNLALVNTIDGSSSFHGRTSEVLSMMNLTLPYWLGGIGTYYDKNSQGDEWEGYTHYDYNKIDMKIWDSERVNNLPGWARVLPINACLDLLVQQALWYGFSEERTSLALIDDSTLSGCEDITGQGIRLPKFIKSAVTRDPHYRGGIAWSTMPNDVDDMKFLGTVAQEVAHAHHDARHASHDHNESDGCGGIDKFAWALSGGVIPKGCTKDWIHPHGLIGTFPAGASGDSSNSLGSFQLSSQGPVGVRIIPNNSKHDLVLVDPCPTASLSRDGGGITRTNNIKDWLDKRWDFDQNRFDCFLNDNRMPHFFMSYGNYSWASMESNPSVAINPSSAEYSEPDFEMLSETLSNYKITSIQFVEESKTNTNEGDLLVTGFIDPNREQAVFWPLQKIPGERPYEEISSESELVLKIDTETGEQVKIPTVMTPIQHEPKLIFFEAIMPSDINPNQLALITKDKTLGSVIASNNSPTVEIIAPNGGEHLRQKYTTIKWKSSDADGDSLFFDVYFSANGGNSWELFASTAKQEMRVPTNFFYPTNKALIKVVTSDGVRFSEDISDNVFTVDYAIEEQTVDDSESTKVGYDTIRKYGSNSNFSLNENNSKDFFDEADSLMEERNQIKDTRDRYDESMETEAVGPSCRIESSTSKSFYEPGDEISINLHLMGDFTEKELVAVSVVDSHGNIIVSRTVTTDKLGYANFKFRLSENTSSGEYDVIITHKSNQETHKDTLQFVVNESQKNIGIYDQVKILFIHLTDQQGNPVDSFRKGGLGYAKIIVSGDVSQSEVLTTVNLFDSQSTSLGVGSFKGTVSGDSEMIISFYIPDDAATGRAEIFANVFSDWPTNGGTSLTGELSTSALLK